MQAKTKTPTTDQPAPSPSSPKTTSRSEKRGAPERIFLRCTAERKGVGGYDSCNYETKRYPERDRASARKELGAHAVETHSSEKKVVIVVDRREEIVG